MKIYSTFKSFLHKKIKLIKISSIDEQIKVYKERAIKEDKFFLLASKYAEKLFSNPDLDEATKKYFFELYKGWDEYGSIPLSLGEEIERLIEDDSIRLGIHRTGGYGVIDNNDLSGNVLLHDIFNNGIKNYGDLSSGRIPSSVIELNKTLSSINNILNAVIYLKSVYKDSSGGVLAAFPSDLVDKQLCLVDDTRYLEIYDRKENTLYVKPEFLLGYIAQDNGVCTYHPKEEFQDRKVM